MPVQPVWWLDDGQAASLPDDQYNDIVSATSTYNEVDEKEMRKLAKEVNKILNRPATEEGDDTEG